MTGFTVVQAMTFISEVAAKTSSMADGV